MGRRQDPGQAAFRSLYCNTKYEANRRKYEFSLSLECFRELTGSPCTYCGAQPAQVHYPKNCNGPYVYNGVDRIDNRKGYVEENCVSCCGQCNRAKWKGSVEEFLDHCRRVVAHSGVKA